MEVCAAAGRPAKNFLCSDTTGAVIFFFVQRCSRFRGGMSSSSCNVWKVLLRGGKQGETFFFLVDLGVNQEFLIAANLMAFSPLKQRWPWIQWPFVGFVGLQRLQRGGDFSSTADHLTLARPRMCKAPIGNELPPQLIKGLNNNTEKTWRKTGGY